MDLAIFERTFQLVNSSNTVVGAPSSEPDEISKELMHEYGEAEIARGFQDWEMLGECIRKYLKEIMVN
jgi:hypothetical protein